VPDRRLGERRVRRVARFVDGLLGQPGQPEPTREGRAGVRLREADELDETMTAAIVGTGGFVGLAKHDVAIRMDQQQMGADKKLTLPGATKDALKQLPEYVKR
jgi:hypothetical protein